LRFKIAWRLTRVCSAGLWIAVVSFRSERGLIVFFPFLKVLIAHSGTWTGKKEVRWKIVLLLSGFDPDIFGRLESSNFLLYLRSWPGKLEIEWVGSVGLFSKFFISPIGMIWCVSFPRGRVLSDSTKRAFAARENVVRWLAGSGEGRS
jgi:hypothetical protein